MMIGGGGAVAAAHDGAPWWSPRPTLGVGLLEFHQLDRMVLAGREAARALLAEGSLDLGAREAPVAELYADPAAGVAEQPLPA